MIAKKNRIITKIEQQFLFVFSLNIAILLCFTQALSQEGTAPLGIPVVEQKQVLLIYSYDYGMPAYDLIFQNIRSHLNTENKFQIKYHVEHMDLSRFHSEEYLQQMQELFQLKYSSLDIDLIITVMKPALSFVQTYCNNLFPDVPTIHCLVDDEYVDPQTLPANAALLTMHLDIKETLDVALKVQPGTREVVVVSGRSKIARTLEKRTRSILNTYFESLNTTYLSGLPMAEVLNRVSGVPQKSIILFLVLIEDGAGKFFVPRDAVSLVSNAANAPVYSCVDTFLGYGIVGGHLSSFEMLGIKIGKLGSHVLKGGEPKSTPIPAENLKVNMFDWRQLKRWDIKEKYLPSESIVRYKQFTFWELYRWHIIGIFLLCCSQALLIFFLLLQCARKRLSEKALMISEQKFRAIFDQQYQLTGLLKPDGMLTEINPAALAFIGASKEDVLGKQYWETPWWHHSHELQEQLKQGIEDAGDGKFVRFDATHFDENGEIHYFDFSLKAIKDENGDVFLIVPEGRDITGRKKTELELQKERDFNNKLIHSTPAYIVVLDLDGKVVMMNEAMLTTLGYDVDEVKDVDYLATFVPERDLEMLAEIFQAMTQSTETIVVENSIHAKDGREFLVEWHGSSIVDAKGDFEFFFGVGIDITEYKQSQDEREKLEAQLRQAQKMEAIGTLAGGIAHDFNNILSPILIYTEMAIEDLPRDSRTRSNLEEVLKASLRAKELVRQVLAFSRQGENEACPLQLSIIVKEVLKLLKASLPANIEVRRNIVAQEDLILADATQLHQVLMNLCTNAAHAMRGTNGTLEITLEKDFFDQATAELIPLPKTGDYLILRVRDSGHGIPPNIMEKIFDPFFTTKVRGEGTGLGLAVVQGIVAGHGGAITVESESGKGTTFTSYFPCLKKKDVAGMKTEGSLPRGEESILVVDDEEVIVKSLQEMLSRLGYTVTGMTSSLQAFELFRNSAQQFDLVITDQTMPEMTGVELAREVRQIRSDMPILLCTGFSDVISEENVESFGIQKVIMKPIRRNELAVGIRAVLDK